MSDPMNAEPIPPATEHTTTEHITTGHTTTLVNSDLPVIPPVSEAPPRAAAGFDADESGRPHNSPLDNVKPERPATHPVAYAALALATLALLLALLGLRGNGDSGYREVKVGNADCVIGPQEGADALYCRTGAVPPG